MQKKGIQAQDTQDALLQSIQMLIDSAISKLDKGQGQKTNEIGKITAINTSTRIATVQVGLNTTTCYLTYNTSFAVNDVILMAIYNGNYSIKYAIAVLTPHS